MNNSSLLNEHTFYPAFLTDLTHAQSSVLIESPFITLERMQIFISVFQKLVKKGIKIYIITRNPREHTNGYDLQAEEAIRWCENNGIQVLLCNGNHHRKLAIFDKKIVYEGSLNILSQLYSREIMRRIEDKRVTEETIKFLEFDAFL